MSTPQPPRPLTFEQRYPEAAGPGVERGDGAVIYGAVDVVPRTFVPPRRDPAEVARERAAEAEWEREHPRCSRCRDVPDEVIEAVTTAMAAAKKGGAR